MRRRSRSTYPRRVSLEIRPLDPADWQTYRDVRLAALHDAPYAFFTKIADTLGFEEKDWKEGAVVPCWIAYQDGTAVGMARMHTFDEGLPHLISMWVAPDVRGTDTGERLVQSVALRAMKDGHPGLALRVIHGNDRAAAFYRRLGFVDNGVVETLPDGRTESEMELSFEKTSSAA